MHYFTHSIIPVFHSKIVLIIKKMMMIISNHVFFIPYCSSFKKGKSIIISISKIMNKIQIMKNWPENMLFFLIWKLNPHSKLQDFSFFMDFSSFIVFLKIIIIVVIETLRIIIFNKFIR